MSIKDKEAMEGNDYSAPASSQQQAFDLFRPFTFMQGGNLIQVLPTVSLTDVAIST